MSAKIERLRVGRPVTWRTLVGLLLVPVVAAGVLLWGLWNPTERLDTMTAAVVNLDEPVTMDGQMVPLGRVLAAELIGEEPAPGSDRAMNFTWLLTDEDDAAAGLDDGRYATVITIPKNFSSAATSMSRGADEAERATIEVQTSDRGRLLDPALSGIVSSTATSVLNAQLGAQYVGNVFVGMTELGRGIGEAADGATQLADGSKQLAEGTAGLAAGIGELSTGANTLAGGTGELATGAYGLASGARELANGQAGFADGVAGLASGTRQAADGSAQLATLADIYVGGANGVLSGLESSAPGLIAQLQTLYALFDNDVILPPDGTTKQEVLEQLQGAIDEFTAMQGQLGQLMEAGVMLQDGVHASADGQALLATGADQLATGAQQLAGGTSELATGLEQYAGGMNEFASGMNAYAGGTAEAVPGAQQLAEGARLASEGTTSLADGLHTAASEVPSYTKAESERMAEVAVQPVEATGTSDELFNASGVPLFAGIALWAGALASFLVLAPLWSRARQAARGVGFITFRSALPALLIGLTQGAVMGVVLPLLLGYDFSQGLGFFGLSLLAGVAFALVNQGLSALFGGIGRFVSFALLVVAFAIGVISTAPPLLQAIGDASPVGALFGGFQAVAMGVSGAGGAVFTLVLWGLVGLALTAFAVMRSRKRPLG